MLRWYRKEAPEDGSKRSVRSSLKEGVSSYEALGAIATSRPLLVCGSNPFVREDTARILLPLFWTRTECSTYILYRLGGPAR